MKAIGIFLLVIVLLCGVFALCFGAEWLGIAWKGYFGPKHAAVEREIFKKTQSFIEGKTQQLSKMRMEFLRMDPEDVNGKRAIASTVRHTFSDINPSILNPELRGFLSKMMNYR